jgi:hypothetical protein|uniref:Uncharacterized protein n=1 Tax=Lactuca sativa TaxID=4236 RepID=A0A9R1W3H9_LACSA|nr:hypothetical protein LSAT_V11C300153400 [Lactuca sativa]
METLKENVQTLTKLFAALEIPFEIQENNTETENNSDNNDAEVIYDFSLDDKNPYSNPYKNSQNNFGLKRKQSYVEDDYQSQYIYGPHSLEENFLYRQGMVKNKQNKWEKIPPQYIPKLFIFPTNSDILFIDCDQNPEAKIQEWSNKMGVQIQLTEELRNLHLTHFLIISFIKHKVMHIVFSHLLTKLKQ